jgi:hypothetical protein
MAFNQEDVERLSPSARVEVQDYYVRRHFADKHFAQPERRAPKLAELASAKQTDLTDSDVVEARRPWPRVWQRNDSSRLS